MVLLPASQIPRLTQSLNAPEVTSLRIDVAVHNDNSCSRSVTMHRLLRREGTR